MKFIPSHSGNSFSEGRGAAEGSLIYGDANQIGSDDSWWTRPAREWMNTSVSDMSYVVDKDPQWFLLEYK